MKLLSRILPAFFGEKPNEIRVVVLGNCQARPIANILPQLNRSIKVTATGIVHLLNDTERNNFEAALRDADFIFAQNVSDTYPCTFVRTSALRKTYGEKVILWYNLFFRGYNPELFYIRLDDRKPLRGPLGDYQSRTIFECWKNGLTVLETNARHHDLDYNEKHYAKIPGDSLAELHKREQLTQLRITPLIDELVWKQRLFFTFNHPCLYLLEHMGTALLKEAGLSVDNATSLSGPEPLGLIKLPTNPWVAHRNACVAGEDDIWTGLTVEAIQDDTIVLGKPRKYTLNELITIFFTIYDAKRETLLAREWD